MIDLFLQMQTQGCGLTEAIQPLYEFGIGGVHDFWRAHMHHPEDNDA